jgi:hypothetical protein
MPPAYPFRDALTVRVHSHVLSGLIEKGVIRMKRTTLFLFAAAAACAIPAAALGADWTDGFESYACDSEICGQGGWVFWDGGNVSPSARVSCDPHPIHTGDKSLRGLINDDIVHPYMFVNSGYWVYSAWQYIPAGIPAGQLTYFILLNQWEANGGGTTNWSTQLRCDPATGVIASEFEELTRPLTVGAWVQLQVYINLDAEGPGTDMQSIFYNGMLLSRKSWTAGVSGGGVLNVGAVDLWFNNVDAEYVYYDDMSLIELDPTGACCYEDGGCGDGMDPTDCANAGGKYNGHGSLCSEVLCPEYGDCGWIITGPAVYWDTTVGQGDDCNWVSGSDDEQFEITIPFTGEWDFSLCGGATWNTVITLGTECCGFDLGFDDNGCPTGTQSLLHFDVLEAGTYFLNLEDVTAANGGEYTITISTPCILECPDGAYTEAEACGDDTNGGCNMTVPGFEPIALDVPICGKVWFDGSTRDTDWYEYIADGPIDLVFEGSSEFVAVIGLSQYVEGTEGSGNCDDGTGYISPFTQIEDCQEGSIDVSLPNAGIYWFFVSLDFDLNDVILCGDEDGLENDYVVLLTEAGGDCPADFDGNGVVNTADLLFLLGAWGTPDGDVDGDNDTDTSDLLALLAAWGPCP